MRSSVFLRNFLWLGKTALFQGKKSCVYTFWWDTNGGNKNIAWKSHLPLVACDANTLVFPKWNSARESSLYPYKWIFIILKILFPNTDMLPWMFSVLPITMLVCYPTCSEVHCSIHDLGWSYNHNFFTVRSHSTTLVGVGKVGVQGIKSPKLNHYHHHHHHKNLE